MLIRVSRSCSATSARRCRSCSGASIRLCRVLAAKPLRFRQVFCEHFYVTTSGNFSNPALLCCMMEMGIDRILFAVDWPFVANKPAVDWMQTVPLCDEDKKKILSGNAQRLFRL